MCSKAQAVRKEQRDEKKALEDERARERTLEYQRGTQANAQRVLRAIDAAGLPDTEHIPWGSTDRLYVGLIRQYAAGEFPDPDKRWYGAELSPNWLADPAKTAKVLGCSTDYLLGVTDDLGRAEPPPPEPEPALGKGVEISSLDREALDTLYNLLEDSEAVAPDIATALRWAIGIVERALGVKL